MCSYTKYLSTRSREVNEDVTKFLMGSWLVRALVEIIQRPVKNTSCFLGGLGVFVFKKGKHIQ